MKLFHEFLGFWLLPLFGMAVADAGGGGAGAGGGEGGGTPAAGGNGAPAAGGAPTGGGGGTPPAGGGTPAAAPAAGSHLGAFIDDKGQFKPGWTKAYGMPDTLEKKFTSPESLLKSYTSLERMLGQDKVVVPGPNSTPEEKAAFFERLGRPAKPEEYGVKMPEKIGDKTFPKELWRDDRAKAFTARAHELGLSKEQVAGLVEFDATAGLADHEASTAATEKAKGDAIAALKTEWGANYDANLKLANAAAKQVGGEDLLKHPLANDPMFIRAMAKVGAAIVEDPAAGARGTSHAQTNPQSEWAKIKGDKSHPYWQKTHPNHVAARTLVQKLFEQMHPEPAAR